MKLFSEEVRYTSTNSSHNILQIENFSEIFFDVFEIEINKSKYPVEKISEHNGNPVVSVPVLVEDTEIFYPFILIKGKFELIFNENNTISNTFPDGDFEHIKEVPIVDSVLLENDIDDSFIEEIHISDLIDNKKDILLQIESAKKDASKAIQRDKVLKLKQISEQSKKHNKALENTLEQARANLVDEFISISDKLRKELVNESHQGYSEIQETLNNKLTSISENLESQLEDNFQNASNIFDKQIKTLVKELYSETVSPKLEKELNEIAFQIVEKVGEIETTLDKKLETKAEKTLVEGVSKELTAIQKANIELNDNINRGVNKALSRAGNVKILVEKIDKEINEKISDELTNIENYFEEKIQNITNQTYDITEESRKYIIDLVNKSKVELLEEIRKIPTEKPIEYIIESTKKDPEKVNLDKLKKEYDSIIHNKFENYKTDLRKYISVYSGGGSVAMQFADGGTMNGNLLVVGSISASQYLGLPSNGSASGDYLPLSGGTVTGDVNITGRLSADVLKFDTTAGINVGVGELAWNDEDGTLDIGLKGGNVTLQVGQEMVVRAVNKTNANLLESDYKVARIRTEAEGGSQGQRLAIVLAQANNDGNSVDTLGLVTENINNNEEGYVTTFGLVRSINTTGSLQGEDWADGDVLYLSPTVAGRLTNIKPQAPQHTVIVGFVVYSHQNNGKIFVKVDNGYELDELHNVKINGISNNNILKYDSLSGLWRNSDTININSLSANRIYTTQLDALSANITVLDIKQYELSGFNVTGDCTIQGNVSASGAITANNLIYNGGNTNTSDLTIGTNDNSNLNLETGGVNRLTILSGGNVGIGTTAPLAKLDILDTTLAGSAGLSGSALSIAQTWNTNLTPTALSVTVTDLSSNASSLLMDLQVGGVTKLKINKSGNIILPQTSGGIWFSSNAVHSGIRNSIYGLAGFEIVANTQRIASFTSGGFQVSNGKYIGIRGDGNLHVPPDTQLFRDSAGVFAQRNGTNAQEFRLYNTYTDASNYERFFIKTNVGATSATQIGLSAAGTGVNRNLEFVVGGSTRMRISEASVRFADDGSGNFFQIESGRSIASFTSFARTCGITFAEETNYRGFFSVSNNSMYGFSSSTDIAVGPADSSFSRISAGIVGVGTGTPGSTAGSLSLSNLTASGTVTAGGAVRVGTATTPDSLSDVLISPNATTQRGLTIQGKPSQTGYLLRLVESTNNAANNGIEFESNSMIMANSGNRTYLNAVTFIGYPLFSFKWSSSTSNPFATATLGFAPTSLGSGILEINNGTLGTLRDLSLRNLSASGTIESTTAAAGIILKSPNNKRWRITVDDNGALTTTEVI